MYPYLRLSNTAPEQLFNIPGKYAVGNYQDHHNTLKVTIIIAPVRYSLVLGTGALLLFGC